MHTFSFARNRALRNRKQRVVSTFSILAVVLLLALSPVASAQHTADQPSPRVGPARKGRPSARPAAKPAPPPKPPAVKRAALQNFEQKVQPDGSIIGVPVELEMGVSETTNPIESAGSSQFVTDLQSNRVNIIQEGLVELIADESVTLYPFDKVTFGTTDAQHIKKTGASAANYVGIVDPSVGASGKAVVLGDLVKVWLRVRPAYAAEGQAVKTDS